VKPYEIDQSVGNEQLLLLKDQKTDNTNAGNKASNDANNEDKKFVEKRQDASKRIQIQQQLKELDDSAKDKLSELQTKNDAVITKADEERKAIKEKGLNYINKILDEFHSQEQKKRKEIEFEIQNLEDNTMQQLGNIVEQFQKTQEKVGKEMEQLNEDLTQDTKNINADILKRRQEQVQTTINEYVQYIKTYKTDGAPRNDETVKYCYPFIHDYLCEQGVIDRYVAMPMNYKLDLIKKVNYPSTWGAILEKVNAYHNNANKWPYDVPDRTREPDNYLLWELGLYTVPAK